MDTSLIRICTSILRTIFCPDKILIDFLKKNVYNTDSLESIRKTDTKSRPQIVNSYRLNLFITYTAVIR